MLQNSDRAFGHVGRSLGRVELWTRYPSGQVSSVNDTNPRVRGVLLGQGNR